MPITPKNDEDGEEDFWANHTADEETSTPKKIMHISEAAPLLAAYIKISMNMMDVIEDHKVLTSLGQDLLLALLSRDTKRRAGKKKT